MYSSERKSLNGRVCSLALVLILTLLLPRAAASASGDERDSGRALTAQQIARLALPSVVSITVLDKTGQPAVQGSGFVVAPNLIATNVHVIVGAHAVTANFPNGRSETVYGVVNMDFSRDMVLLYADTTGIKPLPLGTDTPTVGEPVVAVGSPEGLSGSISTGIVSGVRTVDGLKIIQTTAAISHGSSGGALIDSHGRVIGLTSFVLEGGENLNFAYPSYYLKLLLPRGAPVYTAWVIFEDKLKDKWTIAPPDNSDDTGNTQAGSSTWQAALTSSGAASAAGISSTDKPLAGLKSVYVVIEKLQDNAKSAGLDADDLKREVESQLRDAGISVIEEDDADRDRKDPSSASLYVNVNSILSSSDPTYAYNVDLELDENVCLLRPTPTINEGAATWRDGETGISGQDHFVEGVQNSVKDVVGDFISAYQAQNP